jgi:hypothetical protein
MMSFDVAGGAEGTGVAAVTGPGPFEPPESDGAPAPSAASAARMRARMKFTVEDLLFPTSARTGGCRSRL